MHNEATSRLRVVSSFGKIHAHVQKLPPARRRILRRSTLSLPLHRISSKFHMHACILPALQLPSPKLETTHSLSHVSSVMYFLF